MLTENFPVKLVRGIFDTILCVCVCVCVFVCVYVCCVCACGVFGHESDERATWAEPRKHHYLFCALRAKRDQKVQFSFQNPKMAFLCARIFKSFPLHAKKKMRKNSQENVKPELLHTPTQTEIFLIFGWCRGGPILLNLKFCESGLEARSQQGARTRSRGG